MPPGPESPSVAELKRYIDQKIEELKKWLESQLSASDADADDDL